MGFASLGVIAVIIWFDPIHFICNENITNSTTGSERLDIFCPRKKRKDHANDFFGGGFYANFIICPNVNKAPHLLSGPSCSLSHCNDTLPHFKVCPAGTEALM